MTVTPVAVDLERLVDDRTRRLLAHRRSSVARRGWLVRRALLAADLLGLSLAFLCAQLLMIGGTAPVDRVDLRIEAIAFFLSLPGWVVIAKLYGLYVRDEERADHSTADDLIGVFHLVTVCTWLFFATTWLTAIAQPGLPKMVAFWLLAILAVTLGRAVARSYCRRQVDFVQNTVVLGAGELGQLVARKLVKHPEYGLNLVGLVDDARSTAPECVDSVPLLGTPEELPAIVRQLDVERVVVAAPTEQAARLTALVREVNRTVQVDVVVPLFPLVGPGSTIHSVEGVPLLALPPQRLPRSSLTLKRSIDVVLAGLALVLLSPLLALIALAVKRDSRGPVLFRQLRIGWDDRPFEMLKFRTMVADAEERKEEVAHLNMHARNGGDPRMFKIEDDPRATRLGRLLRRYSLDELPQLWNVLRGEMSLVGPRPLIPAEDVHVAEWGRRRLATRPGMTGLWQVLGRHEIPFSEMVELDYLYVSTWSVTNDVRLMLRTIPVICRGARWG